MSTIVTRASKGSALTHNEMDANFTRGAQTKAIAYTLAASDNRDTIEYSGAGGVSFTIPDVTALIAACDTGDFEVTIKHKGTGTLTITCATVTDTIDGSTSDITLEANGMVKLKSIQAGTGVNIIASHNTTGETLTNPKINAIDDTNGVAALTIAAKASQVNSVKITPAISGDYPRLQVAGEANIGMYLTDSNDVAVIKLIPTSSAVDFLSVTNGIGAVTLQPAGASANVTTTAIGRGTGTFNIDGNSATSSAAAALTPKSTQSSWSIPTATPQVVPLGFYYIFHTFVGSGTGVTIEAYINGSWRSIASDAGTSNGFQPIASDGTNVRISSSGSTQTVYYIKTL